MLAVTVLVLVAAGGILPRLMGTANIRMDAGSILAALDLSEAIPALSLSNIPISNATVVPDMTVTPVSPAATATPAPTVAQPTATPTPVPGGTLTLTFGGSVNIDDGIRKSAYYSDSEKYDFTEILSLLADEMDTDLTFLSLDNVTEPGSKFSAVNAPTDVMDMLQKAGVDLLALGYSKAYDRGMEGLSATIAAASERGMHTIGTYASQADADALCMVTVNNVDVAFIHATNAISSAGQKDMRNDGTSYALPKADADMLTRQIIRARENGADVVVVSLNWGTSSFKVNAKARNFVQKLADAGADIIVGSGTPSAQAVTWLTGERADGSISQTLCAWSLGSLLSSGRNDGNVAGLLLQLQLSYDGKTLSFQRVSYTPTYIWRFKQEDKYQYRVTPSDLAPPDGMDENHIKYMEKALKNIQKVLKDSPVTLREK